MEAALLMKTKLEYEQIIKSLIEICILGVFDELNPDTIHWSLRMDGKEYGISLYKHTNRHAVIEYFYQKVMENV